MDRNIILQMLSLLPPERLGQLVAEVTKPQQVADLSPNREVGFKGSMMPSMEKNLDMYRGPIG